MRTKRVKILSAFLVFTVSYVFFLAVWVNVRNYYGHPMDLFAAGLAALSMKTRVEGVRSGQDGSAEKITMAKSIATTRGLADLVVEQTVETDSYTFNVPLTASLLTACLVFMRWPWYSVVEGIFLIMSGHLLYVYSYLMLNFQKTLVHLDALEYSPVRDIFWEFMWAFTDNLVIRFEPFLVVVIIWLLHGYRGPGRSCHSVV